MSDSSQTLLPPASPSDSGSEETRSEAGPRRPTGAKGAVSKVAWLPQGEMGRSEWLATGRRLGAIGRCSQWWIGDWIRYGTAKWGEKYAEAARVTGYDVASLRNMAWVASRFETSLRSDKLTWSHHVLLAPLEPDQQRYWLERASEERFSVTDLRVALRALREGSEQQSSAGRTAASSPAPTICPHCGHEIDAPAG